MAGIFLQIGDFRGGKYNIPDAGSNISSITANVQEFIDRYEKEKIYELLGVTLGDLIIAYKIAGQSPANINYDKIIGAFASDVTNGCGRSLISQGMTEYLKASVYYEYVNNGLVLSQPGVVNVDAETAKNATPAGTLRFAEKMFNDILDTIEAIQWYILLNSSAFPDFKGRHISVKASNFL